MDPSAGGLDDLLGELRARAPERAVVTSENLFLLSTAPGAFRHLRAAFDSIGAELRPIVYLRPQALLLEALYAELVKHGLTDPFDAVLERLLDDGTVAYNDATHDFDYERAIRTFEDAFGRDAMTVLPYVTFSKPESIIAEFLAIVLPGSEDLDLTALGAWERVNISIGFRSVASILAANRAEDEAAFEDVLEEMAGEKGESYADVLRPGGRYWNGKFEPLGVDDIARMLARFAAGNRALYASYGIEVPVCSNVRLFEEVRSRPRP